MAEGGRRGSRSCCRTARLAAPALVWLLLLPAAFAVESPETLLGRARQAYDAGRLGEADGLLADLLADHPDHLEALTARGNLLLSQGRFAAAAGIYVHLARLRPDNGLYAFKAGTACESAGRQRDAGKYLARAAEQRPGDANAAYRLGLHLFAAGQYVPARTALKRADHLAPSRPDIGLKLAQTLEFMGRPQEAIDLLGRVLEKHPRDTLLRFMRGLMRARTRDNQGAVDDLARVVKADPDLLRAHYALARALLAAGRRQEGEAEMERFVTQDEARRKKQDILEAVQLAGASEDDDPQRFRRRLQGLVEGHPSNPEAHRQLAAAYLREGDRQSAMEALRRVLRLDPDDLDSRRRLGRLLLAAGQADEALPVLEKAVLMAPEDAQLAQLLAEAQRLGSDPAQGAP